MNRMWMNRVWGLGAMMLGGLQDAKWCEVGGRMFVGYKCALLVERIFWGCIIYRHR